MLVIHFNLQTRSLVDQVCRAPVGATFVEASSMAHLFDATIAPL